MATIGDTSSTPTSASREPVLLPRTVGPRTVVSSLWLFAILNYIYCDVLSLHQAEFLRKLLTGDVDGMKFTQQMLLGASVLMTVPMAAVLVSRIAPHDWPAGHPSPQVCS